MKIEFSTNMDLHTFPSFWKKVGELIDGGISEEELNTICNFAESIEENGKDAIGMEVVFQGKKTDLDMVVTKDYLDPSLYLFSTSNDFINAITQAHRELCEKLGV